ncbi:MAG: hypothetical protein V1845_04175 [bacterium]
MKKKQAYFVLFLIILSGLLLFSFVRATTADYLQTLAGYKDAYDKAILQAEAQYKLVIDAADKIEADSLKIVSSQLSADQITEDEYYVKVASIQTSRKQTIYQAESILTANRKIAYQNYQGQRDYAWSKDVLGEEATAPAAAPLVETPWWGPVLPPSSPFTSSPSSVPSGIIEMSPQALTCRYGYCCGMKDAGLISPGQTKYFKIDMTKWFLWQQVVNPTSNNAFIDSRDQRCIDHNSWASQYASQHCRNGVLDRSTYASFGDFAGDVWVHGSDCSIDIFKTWDCEKSTASQINSINQYLSPKQTLYNSGNYTTVFGSPIGFGCDSYVGSAGCEGGVTTLQVAAGYNQVPVYENITNFIPYNASSGSQITSSLSASNPIAAVEGAIVCAPEIQINAWTIQRSSCAGNGETPFVTLDSISATGADAIYLMVHNKEGVARTLEIEFGCPDAK